ncbi:MAG TPA: hypothetical protein VMY78_11895 [Solirubrobacteraceae bacterium]|nr:hypothetical protein [Solirubrobacteraceae bacterium]
MREDLERDRRPAAAARCDVAIAFDVGAAQRLAQPLRAVAGWRTAQVNAAIKDVVRGRGRVLAPIAARTGPLFRADRPLFAPDDFHPPASGYAAWVPVIDTALDRALAGPGKSYLPIAAVTGCAARGRPPGWCLEGAVESRRQDRARARRNRAP